MTVFAGNQSSVPLVDFAAYLTVSKQRWESVFSPPGRLRGGAQPSPLGLGISLQSPW